MKLDPEIVEVVARALNYEDGEYSWELTTAGTREWYSNLAQVALAAVTPLIEAAYGERDALLVEATRLLADIEAQLLPAAKDNWLYTEWKNDLFPRVRSIVPRLRSATQAEGGGDDFNL